MKIPLLQGNLALNSSLKVSCGHNLLVLGKLLICSFQSINFPSEQGVVFRGRKPTDFCLGCFQSINFPSEQGECRRQKGCYSIVDYCFQSINFPSEQGVINSNPSLAPAYSACFQSINFPSEQGGVPYTRTPASSSVSNQLISLASRESSCGIQGALKLLVSVSNQLISLASREFLSVYD